MRPREYCCCAIPLVNAGVYAVLLEQLVAAVAVGILSMATPSIVGAVTPSFASTVLGIVCFVIAAIQLLGFLGVAQEKPILFRRYLTLHSLASTGAFSVALAWIILSLSRHSTAQTNCLNDFFSDADSEEQTEGKVLCNIFPWAIIGIGAGLWAVLAVAHIYFFVVLSAYSNGQQRDHDKYDALNTGTGFQNENFAMSNRNDPFAAAPRPSGEPLYSRDYARKRESAASMSDVLSEPIQQPNENYRQGSYPPPTLPPNAQTEDESPTPRMGGTYYDTGYDGNIERPPTSQAHPAEGSFGRKTPRLIQKNRPFDGSY
ncbi:hypothetical protein HMN09_00641500 [Mycena chlorophos]|uniref:Uncharacterized protein n=1 Tax=Mycena chlorophos TaxID=658473 RepID=A0A8H6WAM4_MYCCL|nr:hypothetical protein HMN09_00641500 [Mycena chlorophos]